MVPSHTGKLMWEWAHQLLRRLSFITSGIMNFISRLKFGDFWWFLGLWLLVLLHPGLNWGSKLDFNSLGLLCGTLALVVCEIRALLALVQVALVAHCLAQVLLVCVAWVLLINVTPALLALVCVA